MLVFGSNRGKASSNPIGGCLVWFLTFAGVLLILSLIVQTFTNDFANAKRIEASNPCEAARIFADIVRQDRRGYSQRAIDELVKVPGACALREMIGLMDVPDSRTVIHYQREELWEEIRIRTTGLNPAPPRYYDPGGEQETRAREQREWLDWFKLAYPKG